MNGQGLAAPMLELSCVGRPCCSPALQALICTSLGPAALLGAMLRVLLRRGELRSLDGGRV